MMKKLLLLLLTSTVVFSCNKNSDNGPSSTGAFTITGVKDVDLSVSSSGIYTLQLAVIPNAGAAKDTVVLSVEGLPAGVSSTFYPSRDTLPFKTGLIFQSDYSGPGGTFPITVVGKGRSGSVYYKMNITISFIRGWKLGGTLYNKTGLTKDPGSATRYPTIKVTGGGSGQLILTFAANASLPTSNRTYKITSTSNTPDAIQIAMYDYAAIYSATGVGSPTGSFVFDSLGKFTFKCNDVEMTDGQNKSLLTAEFSE